MRIAIVTPLFPIARQPNKGRAIFQTALALQDHAEVEVFCPVARYPDWSQFAQRNSVFHGDLSYSPQEVRTTYFTYPAVPFVSRPWNGSVCAKRLYPHLAKMRPDLVLNYWIYPEGYSSVQVSKALRIPVIVGARGSDLCCIPGPITRMLVAKTLRTADYVLTVSENQRAVALQLGATEQKSRSILNGCNHSFFQSSGRNGAGHLIAKDQRVVLFVGRLTPAKGLRELVRAFAVLAHENSKLRLVCIGTGGLHSEIIEIARSTGIRNRIAILGDQPPAEVARWLLASDLLCLPSHSEGCPNVVIEAISSGCPVVATNVGGIPELVSPKCGILVPPQNEARLLDAMRTALSRDWDHGTIAAQFQRTWDDVAKETYEVCEKVVGHPVRSAAPARARSFAHSGD